MITCDICKDEIGHARAREFRFGLFRYDGTPANLQAFPTNGAISHVCGECWNQMHNRSDRATELFNRRLEYIRSGLCDIVKPKEEGEIRCDHSTGRVDFVKKEVPSGCHWCKQSFSADDRNIIHFDDDAAGTRLYWHDSCIGSAAALGTRVAAERAIQ